MHRYCHAIIFLTGLFFLCIIVTSMLLYDASLWGVECGPFMQAMHFFFGLGSFVVCYSLWNDVTRTRPKSHTHTHMFICMPLSRSYLATLFLLPLCMFSLRLWLRASFRKVQTKTPPHTVAKLFLLRSVDVLQYVHDIYIYIFVCTHA